jgi:hypothetical protein
VGFRNLAVGHRGLFQRLGFRGFGGGLRFSGIYERNEPVAPARSGFNESGGLGIIAENFAHFGDLERKSVVVNERIRPELFHELFARDQLIGVGRQVGEHFKGLGRDLQFRAGPPKTLFREVEDEVRKKQSHVERILFGEINIVAPAPAARLEVVWARAAEVCY